VDQLQVQEAGMIRTCLAALLGLVMSVATAAAQCTVPNTLTNNTNADATQVMANFNALLNCLNNLPTATPVAPQGRLTLQSVTPVMTSSQAGKTVIYYTPYIGNRLPIYNGTIMVPTAFTELANITTNSATGNAGLAAVAANSNYDLFAWSNGGTPTLTRGPAWTSDTLRGTGAGTTELEKVDGIWTNKNAIANGPGARLGTYVGTVRSDLANQINFILGGSGAGGVAAVLGVWNAYNRIDVRGLIASSSGSWSYSTAAWRSAGGSDTMRVSLVAGQPEDFASFNYSAMAFDTGTGYAVAGIGQDSTTVMSGRGVQGSATSVIGGNPIGEHVSQPMGYHYFQALEYCVATGGTMTWYGATGTPPFRQTGMTYAWMY
jgi:hypothetical protein